MKLCGSGVLMSGARDEASATPAATDSTGSGGRLSPGVRALLLVALLGGLALLGHATGLTERLSVAGVRSLAASCGAWGVVAFVAAFCVGELIQVPGLVFVAAAVAGWGGVVGGLVAYAGALASVSFSFVLVRSVGGRLLAHTPRPWVQRALAPLERAPVRTIALLRLVLVLSPPLNYALAVSNVRFRDYLLGSALGIVPAVVGCVVITAGLL